MDPIESIKTYKDSTFALMLEANRRGYEVFYINPLDLIIKDERVLGVGNFIKVFDKKTDYFIKESSQILDLAQLDILFIRHDPPFDNNYWHISLITSKLENCGVKLVNSPQGLRNFNEKLSLFLTASDLRVATLVASKINELTEFVKTHKKVVLKPLDGLGGESIFMVSEEDINLKVILETLTQNQTKYIMAQVFIPEIDKGDKRILLVNGEPSGYSLARIPQKGSLRANLAVGGLAKAQVMTPRDYEIVDSIKPLLQQNKLYFVGIDVIGDYLTEINVTSPTGIRELQQQAEVDTAALLFDYLTTTA